ncbi:MAG TPA: aminotransferase class IV [Polyangiaceae bacterium]|nr:aminotransferase class IV [Polyangiaceae bacterium]
MIDGELRAPGAQLVSVFDRGFLYGDSVFETLRTYGGEPFGLAEHMDRLARSAALVFIELPVPRATLEAEVRAAVRSGQNPESYVRVMVTRGQGALGLDPGLAERPTRVIIVQPLITPPERSYTEGVAAITYRTQRQVDATSAVGAKVGNYLVSVLAMREASRVGAVEALIVDSRGAVLEGGTSNIFLVKDGHLITPDISAGILAGITRAHLLRVAEALGVSVELRTPSVNDAYDADELFISSSIRELMPVVKLDDRSIGDGKPGPVFARLRAAFQAHVRPGS